MRNIEIKEYIKHLPTVGLIAPLLFYLILYFLIKSGVFLVPFMYSNILEYVLMPTLMVWGWSAIYASIVNKFLKKKEKDNFKLVFGINSVATFLGLIILALSNLLGIINSYFDRGLLLILMFILNNFSRVWMTSTAFDLEVKTSLKANKFVLIIETIVFFTAIFFIVFGGIIMDRGAFLDQ